MRRTFFVVLGPVPARRASALTEHPSSVFRRAGAAEESTGPGLQPHSGGPWRTVPYGSGEWKAAGLLCDAWLGA